MVRQSVLDSSFRAFRRQAFNPNRRLDIVFVDTCETGEGSVDGGGPTQAFIRLLMRSVLESKYFVGPQNSKSLALDSLGKTILSDLRAWPKINFQFVFVNRVRVSGLTF